MPCALALAALLGADDWSAPVLLAAVRRGMTTAMEARRPHG
jgi:hypothetical protein